MRYMVIFGMLLLMVGVCQAVEEIQPGGISLDLADLDVGEAFGKLSQMSDITILGDSTVKGSVSCKLNGVTIEQALDTICRLNKLTWLKVYTRVGPDEKLSATKLFKQLDALRQLSGSALVCEDPVAQSWMAFVPPVKAGEVDASSIASGLKLKAVYLVRAESASAPTAEKEGRADQRSAAGLGAAPTDPVAAANQVWGYFGQMPVEQCFQVLHELRRMFFDSLTPEQRQALGDTFGGRGGMRGPEREPVPHEAP